MASLPSAENQGGHAMTRNLKWSHAGKGIARKAFERALDREFQAVIRTAKEMAGTIEQPAHLWDLESYLTQSRKAIDRKYDYRYYSDPSILPNMLRQLTQRADLVVGSRYIEGASRRDWTFRRIIKSCLVTKLAQRPLRIPICDPMSGYFLMRRDDFLRIRNHLDGRGFKILLELASKMRSAMVV